MIEFLYRYIKGYIRITLSGENLERFFNLVNARQITIWNITRYDKNTECYIYCKDIYRLKVILRKTRTKICIKERHGLPFFLFYNRNRKMFFAGIFCSWAIVYFMSVYIWNISFEGNFRHTDDELAKFLKTIGIDEGIKKSDIKPENIEKALRNEYFDITWASVEIKGTKLLIHTRENNSQVNENDNINDEKTGDLVCVRDAVITSLITRTGTPLVKIGDEVNKGDVLIAGKYQIIGDDLAVIEEKNVRADGDVVGRVTYVIDFQIDRSYQKKIYSGKEYEIYGYEICNNYMDGDIWPFRSKYEMSDMETTQEQMVLGESFYLPVYLKKKRIREYSVSDAIYSEDEIRDIANEKLSYNLKKIEENTIQILENNVKIEVSEEFCRVYGQITALQNIGTFGGTYE